MRLIDADALKETMYHEAFETDTDMQKCDSGCWIRYKMFEDALENAPTIDLVLITKDKIALVVGQKNDKDASKCEELEINPCRGCEDYDGKGGCLSNGGCANVNEVEE